MGCRHNAKLVERRVGWGRGGANCGVSVTTTATSINVNIQSDHSGPVNIVMSLLQSGAVTRVCRGSVRCMPSVVLAD